MKINLMIYAHSKRINFGGLIDIMPKLFGVTIFFIIWEFRFTIQKANDTKGEEYEKR